MRQLCRVFLFIYVVILGQQAFAMWSRSYSLDWWVNVSDTVAIGKVVDTEALVSDNPWGAQQVTCEIAEVLKGKSTDVTVFRQEYFQPEKMKENIVGVDNLDKTLMESEAVLLFLARKLGSQDIEVISWINLSHPNATVSGMGHAAYNNDCKVLTDKDVILDVVKTRVEKEKTLGPGGRGVMVGFTAAGSLDMHWDFARTADPECKKQFVKLLKSRYADTRTHAIFNLASYPGDDTVKLIRPFLKDKATKEVREYHSPELKTFVGTTVTDYYPVRQAAYLTLTLLGEKVEKPEPYYPGIRSFEFSTGFENKTYFPYGNWKRLDKDF